MRYHPLFGMEMREYGWVPAPSYLLRRARILRLVRSLAPGRVIEFGCGAGTLLVDLGRRGFSGVGVETSPVARALARAVVEQAGADVHIADEPPTSERGSFDYVSAFEVLEHIEDDRAALADWRTYLKPGGTLLLSVPADPQRWSVNDVWAGHFRRYDPVDLETKLREAGFSVERLVGYGWPVAHLIEPLRARSYGKERIAKTSDAQAAGTARSGVERPAESRLYPYYRNPLGYLAFWIAYGLQALPFARHRGSGYLVVAKSS